MLSRDARTLSTEAFRKLFGREPTRPEVQLLQAVGKIETSWGEGWRGDGAGSFNMGAITGVGPTGEYFVNKDSYPDSNGVNHWYQTKFKKYPTAIAGFEDLVRTVYMIADRNRLVLPAGKRGDIHGFSSGLFDTHYYLGFGKDRDERIGHHALAITNACAATARDLGEPMPDGSEPPRVVRVLKYGMSDKTLPGSPIATMQRIVGAKEDGEFGANTEAAVAAWQRANALKPDGKFGPVCYDVVVKKFDGGTIDALFGYE